MLESSSKDTVFCQRRTRVRHQIVIDERQPRPIWTKSRTHLSSELDCRTPDALPRSRPPVATWSQNRDLQEALRAHVVSIQPRTRAQRCTLMRNRGFSTHHRCATPFYVLCVHKSLKGSVQVKVLWNADKTCSCCQCTGHVKPLLQNACERHEDGENTETLV